jgi:WD40 repeat protein
VTFSPDGNFIVSGSDDTRLMVRKWRLPSNCPERCERLLSPSLALLASHAFQLCYQHSGLRERQVWDAHSSQRKLTFSTRHMDNIFSARFLPYTNNDEVVSCAADGKVRSHMVLQDSGRRHGSGWPDRQPSL